jgi:membrane protein required for colicin V production
MIIDIIVVILVVWGLLKGLQKGFIVAIFSMFAFLIGLAAALKLSSFVAQKMGETVKVSEKWLPIIAFAIVFIAVVLLVRLGGMIIQRTVNVAMLGIINRIAGGLLYAALYLFILSVLLFYADQVHLVSPQTKDASASWEYVYPLGPKVIDAFGELLPIFKDLFKDLQDFFGRVVES